MALKTNATLTFTSYEVIDEGINLHFVCLAPGPGEATDYYVLLTDAELATATTQVQLRDLIIQKLQRRYRALNIATKLDQFIGQSVTI